MNVKVSVLTVTGNVYHQIFPPVPNVSGKKFYSKTATSDISDNKSGKSKNRQLVDPKCFGCQK